MDRTRPLALVLTVALVAGSSTAPIQVEQAALAQPPSPEPWHLEPVARYGGATHAVAGAGDVLYAGLGARVVALDIGDPAAPVQIGASPVLGGVVQDLVLEGELLYAAWQAGTPDARRGGLAVLGVADPTHIEVLREVPVDVATRRLAVADGVALMVGGYDCPSVGYGNCGAVVPVDPRPAGGPEIGEILAFNNTTTAIGVSGATAYALESRDVSSETAAVRAIDLGDPMRPLPKAIVVVPGPPNGLAATATRLYMAAGESGLRVVDVAAGPRPVDLGRAAGSGACADDVALAAGKSGGAASSPGALAVLDACAGRVAVYGLATDGWPALVGGVDVPSDASRIAWLGDLIVVARGEHGGVALVDAQRPDGPNAIGSWAPAGPLGAVASVVASTDGAVIAAAHPQAGVTTLRVAVPGQAPAIAGHLDVAGAQHIDMMGRVLVTGGDRGAGTPAGLDLIDVSDPDAPRRLGELEVQAVSGIVVHPSARIAYVSSWQHGLRVIDATDPANPAIAAALPELTFSRAVRGAGGLLGGDASALWTLDVGDPLAPRLVGRASQESNFSERPALAATSDRAFVNIRGIVCGPEFFCDNLAVVDVSDRAVLRTITSHRLAGKTEPLVLAVDGGELLLGDAEGLMVLDAKTLDSKLVQLAHYPAPGAVAQVHVLPEVAGGRLVVTAEGDAGLGVYRLARAAPTIPTATTSGPLPSPRPTASATSAPARPGAASLVLPFAARQAVSSTRREALQLTAAMIGPTFGLAVGDGVVYRGHGGVITVIEPGPGEPREIERTATLPGLVFDLAVEGDRLYAAVSEYGLAVFSVADPRRPLLLGTAATGGTARSVSVSGTIAFVAAGNAGLVAFDVADGTAPRMLSTTPIEHGARQVRLYRDHAYVASSSDAPIQVLAIADASQPRRVAELDETFGWGSIMAFYGNYAYMSACSSCLMIFDVSDPAAPALAADLSRELYAIDVAIDGRHMYAAERPGLVVYDLADPHAPSRVAEVPLWRGLRVAVRDGLVATGGDDGPNDVEDLGFLHPPGAVELVDAVRPEEPEYLGMVRPTGAKAYRLLPSPHADQLFVQTFPPDDTTQPMDRRVEAPEALGEASQVPWYQAWLWDASDPDRPRPVERVPALDDVEDMVVDGTMGYAIRGRRELVVLDLADPANPIERAAMALQPTPNAFAVAGRTLALLTFEVTGPIEARVVTPVLRLVDVGDPQRPHMRGMLPLPSTGHHVVIVEETAWVESGGALHAVDVANPDAPTLLSRLPAPGTEDLGWLGTAVGQDNRLWVATDRGILTVDIADPAQPRVLGRSGVAQVDDLWLVGDDRLLAAGCGVSLFDRSRADVAVLMAELDSLPFAPARCGLAVESGVVLGDRFYGVPRLGGEWLGGLIVLDVGGR